MITSSDANKLQCFEFKEYDLFPGIYYGNSGQREWLVVMYMSHPLQVNAVLIYNSVTPRL